MLTGFNYVRFQRPMTIEYQVGDVLQCGTTIIQIDRIVGDRAWHHGIELGDSSHGGIVLGWCKSPGEWPILRRAGKAPSPEAEELYQNARRLIPDQPWLKSTQPVHAKMKHWLGPE
jgi:hypothetical protein